MARRFANFNATPFGLRNRSQSGQAIVIMTPALQFRMQFKSC
jgi:hypothetical protein